MRMPLQPENFENAITTGELQIRFVEIGYADAAVNFVEENKATIAAGARVAVLAAPILCPEAPMVAILLGAIARRLENGRLENGDIKAVVNEAVKNLPVPDEYKPFIEAAQKFVPDTITVDADSSEPGQIPNIVGLPDIENIFRLMLSTEEKNTLDLIKVSLTSMYQLLNELLKVVEERNRKECYTHMINCSDFARTADDNLDALDANSVINLVVKFLFANERTRATLRTTTDSINERFISKARVFIKYFFSIMESLSVEEIREALFNLKSNSTEVISQELLNMRTRLLRIQHEIANKEIDNAIDHIRDFTTRYLSPQRIRDSSIVQLIFLQRDGSYVLKPIRELIAKSILSPEQFNDEGHRDETLDEKLNSYIQGTENKLLATMNTVSLVSSQDARKEKAAMIGKFIFGVITLTGSISLFSAILARLIRGDYIESSSDGFGGSKVMIPLAVPFGTVFGVAALTASFTYRSVLDVTDNLYPGTSVVSFSIKNAALLFLTGFFVGIAFEYGPSWMEILGISTLIVSGTALTITNAIGLKKSLTITREAVAPNP